MKLKDAIYQFFLRWFPVIVSMGIIFFASADQNPFLWLPAAWFDTSQGGDLTTEGVGQLGHFLEFALLGFTVLRAVIWQKDHSLKLFLISAAYCLVYAFSDEIHQLFVPGRAFQVQDLIIDGMGIIVGILLQRILSRLSLGSRKFR